MAKRGFKANLALLADKYQGAINKELGDLEARISGNRQVKRTDDEIRDGLFRLAKKVQPIVQNWLVSNLKASGLKKKLGMTEHLARTGLLSFPWSRRHGLRYRVQMRGGLPNKTYKYIAAHNYGGVRGDFDKGSKRKIKKQGDKLTGILKAVIDKEYGGKVRQIPALKWFRLTSGQTQRLFSIIKQDLQRIFGHGS